MGKPNTDLRISVKPNLSSKALFHFTPLIENLYSIIQYGLRAYYNYEKLPKGRSYYVAPMVCFCDISLSTIKYHISKYGGYGIGINRTAARECGFTPVFYVHSDSKHINFKKDYLDKQSFTPFIKPFFGLVPILDNNNKIKRREQRKFYDEKEWRLIPKSSIPIEVKSYLKEEELVFLKHTQLANRYEQVNLNVMENIEYIVLQHNREIKQFIENRRKQKIKMPEELIAKIITIEQIQNDF